MAGLLTFKIKVYQTNVAVLPELQAKTKDLSELFDQIMDEWAELNKQKFDMAVGAEESGRQIDADVFWKGLSPQYLKWKRKHFPTGTLMVRTGSLAEALTDPQGFFRMANPEQAIFGTPNDADDALKAAYNFKRRQTIFLGLADQNMIRELTEKFFTVEMQSTTQQAAQLDADFNTAVNG